MAQIYLPGVGGVCYCSIRLSQPSLAGVGAGAELGNNLFYFFIDFLKKLPKEFFIVDQC